MPIAALIAISLAVRLALLGTRAFESDVSDFTNWANTLADIPIGEFYQYEASDYLPGYPYILAATALARKAIIGMPADPGRFALWIKLAPILADLALGMVVYFFSRRFMPARHALIAMGLVLLNPGVILVSSVWGQVDSIGALFSVSALAALFYGAPIVATAFAGIALVVKPQYTLFLLVAGVAYARIAIAPLFAPNSPARPAERMLAAASKVLAPLVVLVSTVQLLLLPFSVSLWPVPGVEWSLSQRVGVAGTRFPVASANAFNLWGTSLGGMWVPDSTVAWLSLSYQAWGLVLLVIVIGLSMLVAWKRADNPLVLIWTSFVICLAFFVLPTRMHERYLFVAIPVIAAIAVHRKWILGFYLATSGLFAGNLWYIYVTWPGGGNVVAPSPLPHVEMLGSWFAVFILVMAVIVQGTLVCRAYWGSRLFSLSRADLKLGRDHPLNDGQCASPGWTSGEAYGRIRLLRSSMKYLLLVAVTLGLTYFPMLEDAVNRLLHRNNITVSVRAYRAWQDTGLHAMEGQTLSISARGSWTNQGGSRFGPEGGRRIDGGAIVPNAPIGALLARVGDSDPFVVGRELVVPAPSTGSVELVMNDWLDGRHDSRGNVKAVVVVK